jgi:hypothetical protein
MRGGGAASAPPHPGVHGFADAGGRPGRPGARQSGREVSVDKSGYDKTVASTWALALDCLQQTAPDAVGLLRLLAFCAPEAIPLRLPLLQPHPRAVPEAIPLRLLLQQRPRFVVRSWRRVWRVLAPLFVLAPLLTDPLAADEAIAALRRYSLVTPAADGSVSVHRLVQAVTADRMTRRRRETTARTANNHTRFVHT